MLFVNLFENDFKLFLPEFFLVTAILTIVLYGSFYSVSREHNYPLINVSTCWASVFTLVNTFFLIVFTRDVSGIIFNGTFICDLLSQNSKLFIIAATIVCLLISLPYIRNYKVNSFEYFLVEIKKSYFLRCFTYLSILKDELKVQLKGQTLL